MEQQEIYYIDCINLGFKRESANDSVWFNQYGYDYFILSKKLNKEISFDWDLRTGFVRLLRVNKQGDILGKIEVLNFGHLKQLNEFFTNNLKHSYKNFA